MSDKVPIRRLPTGVPGLDAVLGGRCPSLDRNSMVRKMQVMKLRAQAPGSGTIRDC
jgi:hypothetical protein